jgi:hypothetical protein
MMFSFIYYTDCSVKKTYGVYTQFYSDKSKIIQKNLILYTIHTLKFKISSKKKFIINFCIILINKKNKL